MATPSVPARIGKYEVRRIIGRGGMGIVYEATDPDLGRRVAIKMIMGNFAEDPDSLKRFSWEALSLGSLQHPNIVTIYDLGTEGGNPYLVMEFLEGESLDAAIANRRELTLLDKISYTIDVCRGLSCAHGRSIIHRDIKPANIMLCRDGATKIFDFGIARAGDQNITRTGQVIGTLKYMAPEQLNARPADARTDIFSTGVVLYQLITDRLPFQGNDTTSTIFKIVQEEPPPLKNFLATYPPQIEPILFRALAKDPANRYATADEFAFDLVRLREELIGREIDEASILLNRGEIYQAQSALMRVLKVKVDHQQSGSIGLLREVEQRIGRHQTERLIPGFGEAGAGGSQRPPQPGQGPEGGSGHSDATPEQLREAVGVEVLRAERLWSVINLAQTAQAGGRMEEARDAVEEALAIDPVNTQARALQGVIVHQIEERERRWRIDSCFREARQEITSRRYTAAFEILKQAEELDPGAPELSALMGLAAAGREQQRRRSDMQSLTGDIQEALGRSDYQAARDTASRALVRFPEERNLAQLQVLAERYCQLEERKQSIDQLLAMSWRLLQAGRNEELREKLSEALATLGPDSRLQAFLEIVANNLERERVEGRKAAAIESALEALSRQAFDEAIYTLEGLASEFVDDVEILTLLEQARGEQERADAEIRRINEEMAAAQRAKELQPEPAAPFGAEILLAAPGIPQSSSPAADSDPAGEGGAVLSVNGSGMTAKGVEIIERRLAAVIGPMARVLVRRARDRASSPEELVRILAEGLEPEEREAFLARQAEAGREASGARSKRPPEKNELSATARVPFSTADEISATEIERAAQVLAAFIGPIANVLTRKTAPSAGTVSNLYKLLAEQVDPSERERFLRSAGLPAPPSRSGR